jgi:trimeric autotransporter adhesin
MVAAWLLAVSAVAAPGDGHWDRQFNMPGNGTRNFALRFNGNSLYTGGYSSSNGQTATNTIVSIFDGTNWTALGDITGGTTIIYDFAFLGTNLYVSGIFKSAGGVPASGLAKWDGANWSGVGGFAGVALALATDGTNLYAGGSFTNAGGIFITNIAKWNGTSWSALGGGIGYYDSVFSQVVNVLAWRGGQLYAGGAFTNAGTVPATNLARWDGSAWSTVGGGVAGVGSGFTGSPVAAMQFLGNDLYVGGNFTTVGGNVPALNVARWNGSAWSALGTGLKTAPSTAPVSALVFLGTDLYAFGGFTNAGGVTAISLAKWNGATWSAFGALNGNITRAISNAGSLYIAGDFNVANYNTSSNVLGNHIIRWDGATFHAVTGKPAQGTHLFVQSLGLGSDGLYMGGVFNVVGATTAPHIARWDGANWYTLGAGVNGTYTGTTLTVRAIKNYNNQLFVGGGFVSAGAVTANNIAMWDGSQWWALGSGVDSSVSAIDADPTGVYVGGSFINATDWTGTYGVNHIARWDASTGWWNLGLGVNNTVSAVCLANGHLYVGGSFTTAGSITANRIAMWDGANWSSLGTGTANGVGGTVSAILVDGSSVYVGGSFTTAGTVTARGIARWDGSSWSSVGQGMFHTSTATVTALAKSGNYLYACGAFTNAGGSAITRNIARWDGTQWQGLGSGVGNDFTPGASRGSALALSGNDVFLGGTFETAGVCDAGYIARWNDQIDFTPPSLMRLSNPQMLPGNAFKFHATATQGAAYVVENSADLRTWTALTTNSWPFLDVTNSVPGVNVRTYRMRQIP